MMSDAWRAGEAIGLADALPDGPFDAGVDEDGDLHMNPASIDLLIEAFPIRPSEEFVQRLRTNLADRCDALLAVVDRTAGSAPALDETEATALLLELGGRVVDLFPYPFLTKFVPDLLLKALERAGDKAPPPLPHPSPGAVLSQAAVVLYMSCLDAGYPPDRLEKEWPEVDPMVADAVWEFCRAQTGFGPVPWESPGYETPSFVFGALRTAFEGVDPSRLSGRLDRRPADGDVEPAGTSEEILAIRSSLCAWLEYMDREIWYMRAAFYRGLVPLLRGIAGSWSARGRLSSPEDVLFLGLGEFAEDAPPPEVLQARREAYLANRGYLSRHAVPDGRLVAILERS
jgi:hypothetical protein